MIARKILFAAALCMLGFMPARAQSPVRSCVLIPVANGVANCVDTVPGQLAPAMAITGNAAGSTAAIVGTLAAASGKTTFICGFNVQAIGGTATVGPITVAGLVGSSQVYQTDVNSATVGKTVASATFNPCIPGSAMNTAITITTTANGTAVAVDVNSWGFQQ